MNAILSTAYQDALTKPVPDKHLQSLFDQDKFNYLRFLYYVTKGVSSKLSVELGTCTGRGTAHLAAGSKRVVTIDPELHGAFPDNTAPYGNIEYVPTRSDDPTTLGKFADKSIDVLFIDSMHATDYCLKEVRLWTPKMVPGGIILLDDLDMMPGVLDGLPFDTKGYLDGLHIEGFGYAVV